MPARSVATPNSSQPRPNTINDRKNPGRERTSRSWGASTARIGATKALLQKKSRHQHRADEGHDEADKPQGAGGLRLPNVQAYQPEGQQNPCDHYQQRIEGIGARGSGLAEVEAEEAQGNEFGDPQRYPARHGSQPTPPDELRG